MGVARQVPDELHSSGSTQVELISAKAIQLPCCRPIFERWTLPVSFDFGNKPVLNYQGRSIFAELLVLRLLETHGWEGVWVSSYGGINI